MSERVAGSVDTFETVWIPMSDGIRLAARMWIPKSAGTIPVPAILEAIPYRRRDGVRDWDDLTHPYLAEHGYACVRVDIRGSGDSDGILTDEYTAQEQNDALEAIAWLAEQPWCSGSVGMMGISWGGFNSLQVAARRPPALKAIVTVCSTDDRYADDLQYMGGALLTGNVEWRSTLFSIMALPPDPLIVGERWREMWMERLEAVRPMVPVSLAHQRRDSYWQHGSVCEEFDAIACPVMTVGGWADGYSNVVFRLLRDLKTPRLGIIGPWGHKYPHFGVPGPAIGFLTEMLRWWDHWLKGQDTGIMAEPMLRAYLQDSLPPAAHHDVRPGRWVGEASWPSPTTDHQRLYLNATGLEPTPTIGPGLSITSPPTTGTSGGEWCAYSLGGLGPELPTDQRQDDGCSLVFDGEPLVDALEILGAPVLHLAFRSNRSVSQAIVRLSEVAPDGQVARVTYGLLNLTHRSSHVTPEALEPGREYSARIQLNDIGHRFMPGHRIRVAVSTAYWPMVFPSPELATLHVIPGATSLTLPVRPIREDEQAIEFARPESPRPTRRTVLKTGETYRKVEYDLGSALQTVTVLRDDGLSVIDEIGVETGFRKWLRYRTHAVDPKFARAEAHYDVVHRHQHGWDNTIRTKSAVSCTPTHYIVESDLEAFEGTQRIFSRAWTQRILRDLT